ncbi:MAG: metal ABC transporter substrate-binding protein, partial [Oscillospiraceae bacterium]|nr:metal ABC transporter substrate-binding protein [Oscillospiraceae bacterium]
ITACNTDSKESIKNNDKLQIVTTTFPAYDWVREILGEEAEVTFLLESGVDMHSFQPSVDDILKISECDMFVYVGGESDRWAQDALKEASNKDIVAVNLLEVLGDSVKEEEILEGMEHDYEEESEPDEHVWLSLKNAEKFCDHITQKLSEIDPENAESFQHNNQAYVEKLSALDERYQSYINSAKRHVLLFADRFPFRYLTDDYDLSYYAAFPGCSAETQASFETITFLAEKINELKLTSVIIIEGSDSKIANTVINETQPKNLNILTLDSMQSVTSNDIENGLTYLSVMENNLDNIRTALN